jgi:multidrug resistance efflux pump
MIAFLTICYSLVYLIVFNKLKLLKKSAANISAFVGVGVLLIGSIVFMWYTFAPIANDARLFRFVIPIVPNVKGQVVEVPVKGMQQIVKGDVIYRIDPTPYQHAVNELVAAVDEVNAQKQLAQTQVNRALELVKTQSAAQVDLDQWTADLEVLKASEIRTRAQLANANWQLQETVVRAPNDGYVANLQVRPGTYVSNIVLAAALTFISS